MKPRLLFVIHYLHLGGAEISLIGLLQALDPKKVDVDLFVYSHEGELMNLIPDYVNLLPEDEAYAMFERPMSEVLRKGHFKILSARLWSKVKAIQYKHKTQSAKECVAGIGYLGKYVSRVLPDINCSTEYDLAISFLTPHNFVCDHVRAKKKICWIHTDYSRIDINVEQELPIWESYDHIMSIAPNVTESFLKVFPSLADKIIIMENILSPVFVRSRADEFEVKKEAGRTIHLLSIGRFTNQKNFDNVPNICRRIIESKRDVKWYIIGFGGDESLIRQKIVDEGMQDYVFILGKRENPYPYIKACDVYVQPSRYEGKSVTVREAQMLCKPVVITNYPTAISQIKDGVDGVIVPMENEGCAKGIAEFLSDKEKQDHIVEFLQTHDYGNESEVNKLYNLID